VNHETHPSASIGPDVELADGCRVGPFCVLSGKVRLGKGVRLVGNNYIQGPCTIGEGTTLYPFACVGFEPQDVKFKPGDSTAGVEVGKNCTLREHATIHAASKPDRPTRLGDNGFLLVNAHVGHDAQVGSNVTMVNNAAVGGHAQIGDNVLMGGAAVVHQFTRVGRFAHIAGLSGVSQDLPPFCICNTPNRIGGINRVGLRRNGFSVAHVTAIRHVYRDILRNPMNQTEAVALLRQRAKEENCPAIAEIADFIAATTRGIAPGVGKPPRDAVAWFKRVQALAAVGEQGDDSED
jgi:UDP-N-acetylglucosamine acyltransferase